MAEVAVDQFDVWNQQYANGIHADSSTAIQPGSVFLYEDLILHGSHGAPSGWMWLESPRQLAEYLLYVGLPDLAGWWLNGRLFGGPPERIRLRDTINWAADANQDDASFFAALADDLDAILAASDQVTFAAVDAVVTKFTDRFGNTPSGNLILHAYPDAVAAGAELLDEHGVPVDSRVGDGEEWLDVCARAGTDPEAGRIVAEVFESAHTV